MPHWHLGNSCFENSEHDIVVAVSPEAAVGPVAAEVAFAVAVALGYNCWLEACFGGAAS